MFKQVGQTFEQQTALCKKNVYLYAPTVTHKFFKLSLFIQSTQQYNEVTSDMKQVA